MLTPDLWLDASDATTITEVGGSVSQWDDKSGNARNFTQAVAADQPTTGTRTLNGLNVIDFDGSNDNLGAGDVLDLGTNNLTVVVVAKLDTTGAKTLLGKYKGNPLAGSWLSILEAGNLNFQYARLNSTVEIAGESFSDTTNAVAQFGTMDRVAGTVSQTVNGGAAASTSFTPNSGTDQNNATGLWMGGLRNTGDSGFFAGYWLDGYIAEVIVLLRTLSASERTALGTYINDKWGVTL
jgi:hypothetical protein